MSTNKLISLLQHRGIRLVFADVGASGEAWGAFQCLMPIADLLRFDPDSRAMQTMVNPYGGKCITIGKAVTESPASEVEFYLTKSPYCSSTLLPDFERLRDYPYEELFEIVAKTKLPATTLEQALLEAGLKRIDWVKLDTQGTECRILQSLPRTLFDRLLVCDIEASLYAHYVNADTLTEAHRLMLAEEFWVANMKPHMRTRGSKKTLETIEHLQPAGLKRVVFQSSMHRGPTTLEMTYARTIRGARKAGLDIDGLLRLFACHYALGAFEYCVEIVEDLTTRGLATADARLLGEISFEAIEQRTKKATMPFVLDRLRAKLEGLLRKLYR